MEIDNTATLTSVKLTADIDESIDEEELKQIIQDDVGAKLEEEYEQNVALIKDGQLVTGKVVMIEPHEVLLDVGYKAEGVIPLRELAIRQDKLSSELVEIGEEIEAVVIAKEDRDGRLILSKKQAQYEKSWIKIEEVYKSSGHMTGVAIEVVKGGLIVDIGLRGFLPASLIDLRRVSDLEQFIGQEMEVKVLELDRPRSNVVLSRRARLEETQRPERERLMEKLMPGDIKEGVISSVVDFGAFVDLGLMDGLIHVSELSWKRIDHPSEVVAVGDKVEVRVLGVDTKLERIALSLRAAQQGPWVDFSESHNVGDLVYGQVAKLVEYGAFIQVGEEVEGLVHISEIASHHISGPQEVISPGEKLWVKIVDIDISRRRISLSIKQAQEGWEEETIEVEKGTDETEEIEDVVADETKSPEEEVSEESEPIEPDSEDTEEEPEVKNA